MNATFTYSASRTGKNTCDGKSVPSRNPEGDVFSLRDIQDDKLVFDAALEVDS